MVTPAFLPISLPVIEQILDDFFYLPMQNSENISESVSE